MPNAGEVNQAVGRAYQYVFVGVLEACIKGYENQFYVETEPEKTSFATRNGSRFSFDFSGVYREPVYNREVFGESKGYRNGASLLDEYRAFLAKAYVTSYDYERHRHDYFWFVTNVPFACREGGGIRSYEFIGRALRDPANANIRDILGDGHVDDRKVLSLAERVAVFILTDSFLMATEISYKVKEGESLWAILKKLHGGRPPRGFGGMAKQIARRNELQSPDRVRSGQRIRLPWHGMRT